MTTDWEAAFIAKGKPVPAWATERGTQDYSMLPEYCREWAEASGQIVIRADVANWRKWVDQWTARGASVTEFRYAVAEHKKRGLAVKGPQSYDWAVRAVLEGTLNDTTRNNAGGFGGRASVSGAGKNEAPPAVSGARRATDL